MVRASYYIGAVLWPEIAGCVGYRGAADWERWIRRTEAIAGEFGETQHHQQTYAAWLVPAFLSGVCILIPWIRSLIFARR